MPVIPRAVGVRLPYADIPDRVRRWVETTLGASVVSAEGQSGGMSPGCATRLRTSAGTTAFVKAVGASLNPETPALFRHEAAVLRALRPAPYRPGRLGDYDDGDWVALLLADVDGRYPDLADPHGPDAVAVRATLERQARELTPSPPGLHVRTLPEMAGRWLSRWQEIAADPARFLPEWAVARAGVLHDRVATLPTRLATETLCHWDVRDDNLLIRPDGGVVIVDWGMACIGPAWGDAFALALTWADSPVFDELMRPADPETVTDLLLLFGGSQARRAAMPAPPGLPAFPAFCRRDADRQFAGAARRLCVATDGEASFETPGGA
ncbi:phosphotransferase family protein [Jiangella asiatica]|uniref:Aminoglycoside phosphotransferase family protein n=1 Tax=Jiangella asiatica TaxID=2530372 RepID=A0A4R5CJ83_9ACTN|nr:aminoglycoside phosphotransferase family protein [Jiangella asiatica]TDE00339.1 aminoglycoside phosphotransferase family protein [Jiangella asiatica]